MYPDSSLFTNAVFDGLSSGFVNPYPPYIGLPSYAHPINFDTPDDWLIESPNVIGLYPYAVYFKLFSVSTNW